MVVWSVKRPLVRPSQLLSPTASKQTLDISECFAFSLDSDSNNIGEASEDERNRSPENKADAPSYQVQY